MNHSFKPYADIPDMCVAELYNGDTCNRPLAEHSPYIERLARESAMPCNPHPPGTFAYADVEAYRHGRHWTQQPDDMGRHP